MRRLLFILASVIAVFTFSCDTTSPEFDESVPDVFDLEITITPEEAGSVSPSAGEYVRGSTLELTAEPELGFVFQEWGGDLSGSQNPTFLRMSENRSVTAVFAEADIPLSIVVTGQGTVNQRILSQVFKEVATSGHSSGESAAQDTLSPAGPDSTGSINIQSDGEIEGNGEGRDQLRPDMTGDHMSGGQPGQMKYSAPRQSLESAAVDTATVELTAEPNDGWLFERWEGDLTGNQNPDTLVVNKETNITAVFREVGAMIHSLELNAQGQGVIEADPDRELYDENQPVTLTAVPDEDWRFSEWQGDLEGAENPQTLVMDGDKSVTAIFSQIGAPIVNIVQQPSETTAGEAISPAPTLQILNDLEIPIEGVTVTATLNNTEFTSSSTVESVTDDRGIARFDNLVIEEASEENRIVFNTDNQDISSISSDLFDVVPAAPDPSLSEADVPDGVAGETTTISITLRDSFSNLVDGASDALTVEVSGANSETLSVTSAPEAGVYTTSYTPLNSGDDAITIMVNGSNISGSPFTSSVTTSDISSSESSVSAEPVELVVDNNSTVTIELRDAVGNAISGLSNSDFDVDISGSGEEGAVSETSTSGNYQFSVTNKIAEQVTAEVRADGVALDDTPQITFTPGAPDLLAIPAGSQPGTSIAGQPVTNSPTVRITDEFGNNIPGLQVSVEEQGGQEFASGAQTLTTNSNGRAVFDDLVINDAGRYNLVFTAGSLTATSNAFNVNPADGNASVTTADVPNGAAGDRTAITITVRDAFGNRVEGAAGDLSVSVSGANSGASVENISDDGNGVYTTGYTPTSNGTDQITIELNGTAIEGSPFTSEVTTSEAAIVLIEVQPGNTTAGATVTGPPSVLVTDDLDNPVSGIEVVATAQGPGSFVNSTTTVTTGTNGIAVFSNLVLQAAGSYTIEFNAIGVSDNIESGSFNVAAAAADDLVIESGNNQSGTVTEALNDPFVVSVTDRFGNPVSGEAVSFSITGQPAGASGQSLSSTSVNTNGSGEASSTLTLGDTPGNYSVEASVSGVGTVIFGATANAGAAESFDFDNISSPQTAGEPFNISITALDSEGNRATGYQGSATLSVESGSISPNSISFTNGSASEDVTLDEARDDQRTTAEDGSITGTSNAFDVESGSIVPLNSDVNASPTTLQVGNSSTLSIQLRDGNDNVISGLSDSDFTIEPTGNATAGTVTESGSTGNYSTTISNNTAEQVTITVSALGVEIGTVSITFTPGEAENVNKESGDDQTGSVNEPLPGDFVVKVTDAFGNEISGETVFFSVTNNAGGSDGSLSNTQDQTDSNGLASTTYTLGDAPGEYAVTASVNGGGSVDFTATAQTGSASQMSITTQPSNTTAGDAISPAPEVEVTDDFGNPVEGISVTVSLGGGSFNAGTTTQSTNSSGVATFSGLVIETANTGYSLTFNAATSGVSNETSNTFAVTAAGADNVTIESGNNQTGSVSEQLSSDFVVNVTDTFGNEVSGETVSFSISGTPSGSDGASLSAASDNTDGSGLASTRLTLGDTPGTYTVDASVTGAGSVTFSAEAQTGSASQSAITTQPSNTTAGSAISPAPSIEVTDDADNPVEGIGVTVSLQGGSFNSGTTTQTTNSSGIASFSDLVINAAGSYSLEFDVLATGVPSQTSTSFDVTAADANSVAIESGNNQSASVSEQLSSDFVVNVTDTFGNEVSGETVSFSISGTPSGSDGASLSATSDNTDGSGLASTRLTLGDTPGTYTVDASVTGAGSVTFSAEASAGAASSFSFDNISSPKTAGQPFAISITALDGAGNTATGYNSTANLSTTAGSITPATANFNSGEVSLSVDVSETGTDQTITAEDGSITGTSNTFDVESGSVSAVNSSVSASPTTLDAGTSSTLTIELRDGSNNPISSRAGDIVINPGGDATTGPVTEDGSTGNYQAQISNTTAETVNVSASIDGTTVGDVDITFTPGNAEQISAFTIASNEISLDGSTSVTATVLDGNSNPVQGVTVSFSSDEPTRATVEASSTTDTNGKATAQVTGANNEAGNVVITASIDNSDSNVDVSDTETVTLTVSAGSADAGTSSIVADRTSNVTADGTDASTLTITVRDASNNELSGEDVFFDITGGTGSLSSGPWTTDTNGQATATLTSTNANTVETTGYLGTNASGSAVGSVSVDFVPGDADAGQSEITADDASIPADGSSTTTIRMTLKDANGNELTAGGDNVGLTTDAGTLLSSITDNGDGTYSQDLQSSTTVETATVEGTVDGSPIGTVTVDFVTGAASEMTVDTQPLQSTAGQAISGPPSVLVTDSGTNPVNGVAVTASLNGAALTAGSTDEVSTNTSGIAEFTNLVTETAGTGYTLAFDADAAGVDNVDSDPFDVVAGSPASVSAQVDNGTALADGSDQLQFTVTVEDANSNPVSGVSVDATNNGSDISYPSGTSVSTDGSGQATFNATSTTAQPNVDFTFTEQVNSNSDSALGSFEDNSDFSLTDPGTQTSGVEFNVEITGAQDIAGNALDGSVNVTVNSDQDGDVHDAAVTFTSGSASVPVTLTTVAEHTLTVNVDGVTDDKTIQVTVN
ncbi:MAG: hypothetical protein GVY08_03750 [Bacteroidetes bacterium]|jgi:adhesin/invasin|nr:hypothetical protein [Bacteroidota bacterium]